MRKTRDGEGAEPGYGGGGVRGAGRCGMAAEPSARLDGSLCSSACSEKNNPHDEHGQLEKKNANRFAITTFSSC